MEHIHRRYTGQTNGTGLIGRSPVLSGHVAMSQKFHNKNTFSLSHIIERVTSIKRLIQYFSLQKLAKVFIFEQDARTNKKSCRFYKTCSQPWQIAKSDRLTQI